MCRCNEAISRSRGVSAAPMTHDSGQGRGLGGVLRPEGAFCKLEALEFRFEAGRWGWDGGRVRMAWGSDPRASKWAEVRIWVEFGCREFGWAGVRIGGGVRMGWGSGQGEVRIG